MKFLIFLISLSIVTFTLSAQQDAPKAAKITAKSGLNMRAKPDFQSQSYGVIQYDKKVKVLKWGSDQNQIKAADGTYGFWVKAQYGNKIGYLFSTYIEADWTEYTPRTTTEKAYVIAASGLKLRQKPSANAGVIKSVSYGTEIIMLEEPSEDEKGQYTDADGVSGYWLKAKVGADVGYLFSGYLTTTTFVKPGKFNSKYRLEFIYGCNAQVNYDPNMNWYAMFVNKSNPAKLIYSFEPVKLKMRGNINEFGIYSFAYPQEKEIEAKSIYPHFLVGSVKPLKSFRQEHPSNLNSPWFNSKVSESISFKSFVFKDLKIKVINGEKTVMSGIYGSTEEVLRHTIECEIGSKKYVLDPFRDLPIGDYPQDYPIFLDYYGDLDADGIDDLVLAYNDDGKNGKTLLYLSSEAEPGERWKLVSYRDFGYCC